MSEENNEQYERFEKLGIRMPPVQIFITYLGASDEAPLRPITIKRLWTIPLQNTLVALSIDAFCHRAGEMRTFKLNKIIDPVEGETGVEIHNLTKFLFNALGTARKRRFPKELNMPLPDSDILDMAPSEG